MCSIFQYEHFITLISKQLILFLSFSEFKY